MHPGITSSQNKSLAIDLVKTAKYRGRTASSKDVN